MGFKSNDTYPYKKKTDGDMPEGGKRQRQEKRSIKELGTSTKEFVTSMHKPWTQGGKGLGRGWGG